MNNITTMDFGIIEGITFAEVVSVLAASLFSAAEVVGEESVEVVVENLLEESSETILSLAEPSEVGDILLDIENNSISEQVVDSMFEVEGIETSLSRPELKSLMSDLANGFEKKGLDLNVPKVMNMLKQVVVNTVKYGADKAKGLLNAKTISAFILGGGILKTGQVVKDYIKDGKKIVKKVDRSIANNLPIIY